MCPVMTCICFVAVQQQALLEGQCIRCTTLTLCHVEGTCRGMHLLSCEPITLNLN